MILSRSQLDDLIEILGSSQHPSAPAMLKAARSERWSRAAMPREVREAITQTAVPVKRIAPGTSGLPQEVYDQRKIAAAAKTRFRPTDVSDKSADELLAMIGLGNLGASSQ